MLFATNTNLRLARAIARTAGMRMGKRVIDRYADGEVYVQVGEHVKDKTVYVCGSTFPPSDNAMELCLLINALKENGARRVCAIIPYFAYGKADHIARPGTPLSAKFMAQAIELAGADETIAVNLHSPAVGRFFRKQLIHVDSTPLLASYFEGSRIDHLTVAAPDVGGNDRALRFARALGMNHIVRIRKERPRFNTVKIVGVQGDVAGASVIIVDDMIQSGSTIIESARALVAHGARDVYVAVTHVVPTDSACMRFEKEQSIKKVVLTDTIPQPKMPSSKFKVLSVASLIAGSISKS